MTLSVMVMALLVSPSVTSAHTEDPRPSPAIIWVKADGPKEVVRIAFLGFDVKNAPTAPATLEGKLHYRGKTVAVKLRRNWQGFGAVPEGWVPADYAMDVPHGADGDAVLSLSGDQNGWFFRLGAK